VDAVSSEGSQIVHLRILLLPVLLLALIPGLPGQGRSSPGVDADAYWVFFTDKGITNDQELRARIESLKAGFSPRSLKRRSKVRGSEPLGWEDLPVYEPYVRKVVSQGVELRARSKWLNAVSVSGSPEAMAAIARLPFVTKLKALPRKRPGPELPEPPPVVEERVTGLADDYGYSLEQLTQIQVTDLHAAGFHGEGMLIGMLDTGFYLHHTAFDSIQVIAAWDFVQGDSIVENQAGDDPSQHDHGTKTLSTIAGYDPGNYLGAAYRASFALAKTEILDQEVPVEEDYWVAGLEWLDSLGVDVVNSSLIYTDWYSYSDMDGETAVTTIAADQAILNGIVICNAAGNFGSSSWKYIGAPADGDQVIAVGAVDSNGNRVYFSSQGPTYDGRIKPDVCARGYGVYSVLVSDTTGYGSGSGTSFSSPLTAGACALLLQAHPDWEPWLLRHMLRTTATQAANPDTFLGWGVVQAYDAFQSPTSVPFADRSRPPAGGLRLVAGPSPSTGNVRIQIDVESLLLRASGFPLRVDVFDVTGSLVRTLAYSSGVHSAQVRLEWDGRDGRGRASPTGVYLIRAAAGYHSAVRKVILLR